MSNSIRLSTALLLLLLIVGTTQWCLKTTLNLTDSVTSVDFAPDGTYIAVTSLSANKVDVYDTINFFKVFTYTPAGGGSVSVARFSRNSSILIVGKSAGRVNLISGKPPFSSTVLGFHQINTKNLVDLDVSYDDQKLVLCYSDTDTIQVINNWFNPGSSTTQSKNIGDKQVSCQWSKNGDVAIANDNKKVEIYTIPATGAIGNYNTRIQAGKDFTHVAIKPTTTTPIKIVATGGNNNQADACYFTDTGGLGNAVTVSETRLTPDVSITSLARTACYSPTADYYAVGGDDKKVWMFDDATDSQTQLMADGVNSISDCDFTDDGEFLAAGTDVANGFSYVLIYSKTCFFCSPGFYIDTYAACQPCSSGVAFCSLCHNASYCVECNRGHYITDSSTCTSCETAMEGCSTCPNSSVCLECNHGFYLTAGNVCASCSSIHSGCLICSLTACILCEYDYYLSGGSCSRCQNQIDNCVRCTASNLCIHCSEGFYPASSGSVCSRCDEGCVTCHLAGSNCTLCARGYYSFNFTCSACLPNCLECNQTQCLDCVDGYHLNGSNVCFSCLYPCSTCYNQTVCLGCVTGYYLSSDQCLSCTNNCSTCISITNCTGCDLGYYLTASDTCLACEEQFQGCQQCSSGTCLSCDQTRYLASSTSCDVCQNVMVGCQYCSSNSVCEQCAIGYYHSGATGALSCLRCPEQCGICQSNSNCSSCQSGFYLNVNTCSACLAPCLTCNSTGTECLSCLSGFYFNGNSSCLPCTDLPNCYNCQDNVTCSDCQEGFFLNSSFACQICAQNCSNCNSSHCHVCTVGFYLSGVNTCSQCDLNCSMCNSSDCLSCDVGFYLSTNVCLTCNTLTSGCLTCNNTHCYACFSGFYLDSSGVCLGCESTVSDCLVCSGVSACTRCQDGFYLSSPSSCLTCSGLYGCLACSDASTCLVCASGYYLLSSVCEPCPSGCSACSSNSSCSICDSSSYLFNNSCLSCQDALLGCVSCTDASTCLSCGGAYLLNTTTFVCEPCSLTLPACSLCDPNATCMACQQGYYLNAGSNCQLCSSSPSLAGCLLCNSSSICQKCTSGYYLSANVCTLCNSALPACQQCSSNTVCLDCSGGYFLNGTAACELCSSTMPGCIFCSSGSTCTQCQGGYYLSSGSCLPCTSPGCEICNATVPANCITCNSGYYLAGSSCSYCPQAGCLDCNSSVCLSCQSGYYLAAGTCSLCSSVLDGCSKCSSASVCLQCQSLFYLDNVTCSICNSAITGCSFCSDNTTCLACDGGYYLNISTCAPCSDIEGCLICSNISLCLTCTAGYFEVNNTCAQCILSIQHCFQCSNSTVCLSCESGYTVSAAGACEAMQVASGSTAPVAGTAELTFKTHYINQSCLRHALAVADKSASFQNIDTVDWASVAKIFIEQKTGSTVLTIISVQLSSDKATLYFYTDNPITVGSQSLPVADKGRILAGQSMNQLNLQASLSLPKSTINSVLPSILVTSDLALSYNLNDSTFYVTFVQESFTLYYYLFGLALVIFTLIYGFSRATCLSMHSRNIQFFGHLLALKSVSLVVFPTYAQYVNFCLGFMTVDLPWLNILLPSAFSNEFDLAPTGYYFYFKNMNIASMHLFTLIIFLTFLGLGYLSLSDNKAKVIKIDSDKKSTVTNFKFKAFKEFLMNFFGFGLAFAGFSSVLGTYLNTETYLTLNGMCYIVGIVVFGGVILEACACIVLNKRIGRFRMVLKATLLAGAGLNPLYMATVAMVVDIILLLIEYYIRRTTLLCPKSWFVSQLLLWSSLVGIFYIPDSFLTLGIVIALVVVALGFEIFYFKQEKKLSEHKHRELFEEEQNIVTGDPFQKIHDKSYMTHEKQSKQSESPDHSPGKEIIFEEASMEDAGLGETKFVETKTTHFNPQGTNYSNNLGHRGRTRKFKQVKQSTGDNWNLSVFNKTKKSEAESLYFEE